MSDDDDRLTVTAAELAKILGQPVNFVYRLARESEAATGSPEVAGIPGIRISARRIVFSREQVDRRLRGEPMYQRTAS